MAKKFGKLVLLSALAGAAAAGTYYCLQKKQDDPLKDIDAADDFDESLPATSPLQSLTLMMRRTLPLKLIPTRTVPMYH